MEYLFDEAVLCSSKSMYPDFLSLSGDIREEIGIIKVGDAYCAMIDKNTADKWKYLKND